MNITATIDSLDFGQEIERMETRSGLEKATAELAVSLYRKFLILRMKYGSGRLTPSKLIDEAWHEHMADTQKYMDDCQKLGVPFIHHDPKIVGEEMERRFADTKALFVKEFGIDLHQTARYGHHVATACGS